MTTPTRYVFTLNIPAREWQRLYSGQVSQVLVVAHCGTRVQLPASHLRRFVQYSGVAGHFELLLDADRCLLALNRLPENKM